MDTTTGSGQVVQAADRAGDLLRRPVDELADHVERLLVRSEFVCGLEFDEAEALAELLDAGHHTMTAARLIHRWVLTEPDWGDDEEHLALLEHWLTLSVTPPAVARAA